MAQPNREQGSSTEMIDDALRLVDALQRKLIIAGVRRGMSGVVSPQPRKDDKDDVWAEAVKEEPESDGPVFDQVIGIARETLPQVGRHLGEAGLLMVGAVGRTLSAVERSLQYKPRNGPSSPGSGGDGTPVTRAD